MTEKIWAEKPEPRNYSEFAGGDWYTAEEMDAFHEKLKAHYKSKNCGTCKHLTYTKWRESYCRLDGSLTSAERTCSHWEG